MPELPEVETTRRGIEPYLIGQSIVKVIIRHRQLRWPVSREIDKQLPGSICQQISRRGKYLLLSTAKGTLIIHLGMSGRLHLLKSDEPAKKHDHADLLFGNGYCLRFTDPRRFGSLLWCTDHPYSHPLLSKLGPEPLSTDFGGTYLFNQASKRRVPVKQFIMNSAIVVGVGNIYAQEALFLSHILPSRPASSLDKSECILLVKQIKKVLQKAIKEGGTTLKDFLNSEGKPGYFQQQLTVYGRAGKPCLTCKKPLSAIRLGQRSTVFCEHCQT